MEEPKKKRTMFTAEQKSQLEVLFGANPYPDKTQRKRLADDLGVKDKSIDYWFGHRRAKHAKFKRRGSSTDSESLVSSPDSVVVPTIPKASKKLTIAAAEPVDVFGVAPMFDVSYRLGAPALSDFDDCHDLYTSGTAAVFAEYDTVQSSWNAGELDPTEVY
eukprot:TRINITY_DN2495_c0_g2_i1.p1 TRINITY_DN2495_c0_g2~~TRINITY_DN2495_c0_g2_i1.p1  ORF type:complete len:161 (-),score=21.40 TRINITY_DN2495_c0_g2_i1:55-537(-)